MSKKNISVDYDHSILAVSCSILKAFGVNPAYPSLDILDRVLSKNYKNVVFMILDCLGSALIEKHLDKNSFISSHILSNINTIFPPTTTAATTTFHSALPPIKSAWLGWKNYFPQYDMIIESFRNTEYYSGKVLETPPVSETILKYTSIYDQITAQNKDVEYYRIFPPFDKNGVSSFAQMCQRISNITKQSSSRKIISAYWNEPDHTIHQFGVNSLEVKNVILALEKQIEQLFSKLEDTLVIISADHGAIDVEEVYLNNYPDICTTFKRPPALESRFLTFFIKDNCTEQFAREFKQHFPDFVLYSKEEFLASNILGFGEHNPLVETFLGEFVAISTSKRALRYTTGERELSSFKADHSGFTEDEMRVPLIILEKRN